jgi:hypothetical protein
VARALKFGVEAQVLNLIAQRREARDSRQAEGRQRRASLCVQLKGIPHRAVETLCVIACNRQASTPFGLVRRKGADNRVPAGLQALVRPAT